MEKEKFYVTTPIYYTNGSLHLGHCYTTVLADCIARYKRLSGFDVYFLTGTDEHGQKVQNEAHKLNLQPKQYVDGVVEKIKDLWKLLGISYDRFIRTTDEYHEKVVQKIFKKIYDKGLIYKSEYKGLYCTGDEAFYTPSQAVDGCCPDCGRKLEETKEEAYFFKLSAFQKQIEDLVKNTSFVNLEKTRNEMLKNFIEPGLEDLCVSRTSFNWGVPVDFDPKHVVYVWIDALTNYITALGYMQEDETNFKKYWPADLHLMAKEITRFHTIIWPAILMALDLPLPKTIHAHGWLTTGEKKMGKSLGNGFNPYVLCERCKVDGVRYYLLKEGPLFGDTPYSTETFLATINKDLSNQLGNLLSRTCAMVNQNFGENLPTKIEIEKEDEELLNLINSLKANVDECFNKYDVKKAIEKIMEVVDKGNKYIELTEPWKLAKEEGKKQRLQTVLNILCETVRVCTVLLQPMIPETCERIFEALGVENQLKTFENAKYIERKNAVIKKGEPIFARLNIAEELKIIEGKK